MPTVAASHFTIDLPTLFVMTMFISVTGGVLLLFSFLQNRKTPALAFWGCGYLIGAVGAGLLAAPAFVASSLAISIANALLCGAYASMWGGARSFEGRRVHVAVLAAGPAIWIAAFQFDAVATSVPLRVSLVSTIMATYTLFGACELYWARDRHLWSRWPTLAVLSLHACFLLARIPFASDIAVSTADGYAHGAAVSVMAFEALLVAFSLPFLRVTMVKERAELEQRKAALTDALTGIANRRAFFDRGAPLLDAALADRRPTALLLFDLDRFKEVNDTAGHQAGDRVLQAFSDIVSAAMRPGDLFGRLGGEEFACLLSNTSMTQALNLAEHLRRRFAAVRLPDLVVDPTVSVGVAMASEAGRDLPALLAIADRALYRAKADGRNRVAPAPLLLVEATAGEPRRAAERSAMAAPLAG
jgi:diguanylate cyclase (GGDEF)-like protein